MPLTIYKSSAGSGKTFTLVKEYLKIVLKNPQDYQHILALTFTNKATEEMKGRILKTLEEVILGEGDMFKTLIKETEIAEANLKKNARQTLDLILHNYSRFEVSTIDSFFARVIRSFAKELQLPLRYDMEMDTDMAIENATEFLFAHVHENKELAKWLMQYSFANMDNDKGWNIENQLKELGKTIFDEEVYKWLEDGGAQLDDLNETIRNSRTAVKIFEETLQQAYLDFEAILQQNQLSASDLKHSSTTWILKRIKEKNYKDISAAFRKTVESGEWQNKKSANTNLVESLNSTLTQIAGDALAFYEKNNVLNNSYKAFLHHIYAYGVLGNLSNGVKAYRDEKNLLLISDVNAIITSAIGNDDAPFLYEKLGSFYKHLFVDEFQDTSNFQWNNLKPLVYNSVGEGEEVLIVGDVKQSIYRFRGGNLNLLLNEVKDEFSQQFSRQVKDRNLSENWRSNKEIVEFNNLFFGNLSELIHHNLSKDFDAQLVEDAYKEAAQIVENQDKAYVEVRFFKTEKKQKEDDDDDAQITEQDDEQNQDKAWKAKAKTQLVEALKQVKTDGYTWNDVMILVFKNAEANEIADLLINENIPFVSSHSLLAESSLKVKFIVQIMHHLQRPDDAIAHGAMLYLYHQIKNKKIWNHHWLFSDFERKESILKDLFPPAFFEQKNQLQRLSIYELVEELSCIFELNLAQDAYLQYFANVCLKQTAKGVVTLFDFLQYWDENKQKLFINTPENLDAVSIMTIHKAKGLEKPVVFLPFMVLRDRKNQLFWTNILPERFEHFGYLPLPFNDYLKESQFAQAYLHEQLSVQLDNLNKVYVAFTRPRNRLYIYTQNPSKEKSPEKDKFNNVNDWIHRTLLKASELSKYYQESEGFFCFGEATPKKNTAANSIKTYELTGNARSYKSFINIRSDAKEHFLLFDSHTEDNITQGLKAHAVLERLYQKNDLERVLAMLLSEGLLLPEDLDYLRLIIQKLFDNPLFASWFNDDTWQVLAERDLLEGDKNVHKPDRVLLKNDKAIVIDYKKLVEDEKYLAQVRRYGKLLQQMGYNEVKKYLVYVDTGIINEVL